MKWLLFSLLSTCLCHLRAQPPQSISPWSGGVMAIWDSQPYKQASGQVFAFPFVSYRGERIEWQGPRVRIHLLEGESWKLAGHATVQFPAYAEDDAPILEGMGDRSTTLVTGLDARYPFHPRWSVHSKLDVEAFGAYYGVQWIQGLRWSYGSPASRNPLFGHLEVDLVAQDKRWTGYMVGVSSGQTRPDRPAYTPQSTVFPAIGGTAIYRLGQKWSLFAAARFDAVGPEWLDSPLIENDYRLQTLLALQRTF